MKRELIEQANNNIRFAREYIENNRPALECMDLKLHDAAYYSYNYQSEYKDINATEIFYFMCDIEYHLMEEEFKMSSWDWDDRRYIGRTSKFYLNNNYYLTGRKDEINEMIYTLLDKCGWYMDLYPDIEEDHLIENEDLDEAIANVEYIASQEFIDDLKKELAPIIGMYKYIKWVKDKQVELLKDYIYDAEYDEMQVWLDDVEKIIA